MVCAGVMSGTDGRMTAESQKGLVKRALTGAFMEEYVVCMDTQV